MLSFSAWLLPAGLYRTPTMQRGGGVSADVISHLRVCENFLSRTIRLCSIQIVTYCLMRAKDSILSVDDIKNNKKMSS